MRVTREEPGWTDQLGDLAQDFSASLLNVAGHVLNGVASFGNAVAIRPRQAVEQ